MNIGKETKAYWGDKFIEILDPHKPGHIVRVYPDYWDEKAPIREQGEPVAYMSSTKNNQLVSKTQYDSMDEKNKLHFDIPLFTTLQQQT